MAASYLMGFPWADNPDSSVAVYVVAENQELADAEALRLAGLSGQKRMNSASRPRLSMKEAIDAAFESIGEGDSIPYSFPTPETTPQPAPLRM